MRNTLTDIAGIRVGHAGDAHEHINMFPATQAQFDAGTDLMPVFAAKAASLGGSVAAEHGPNGPAHRIVDRLLQRERKAGRIEFLNGSWHRRRGAPGTGG